MIPYKLILSSLILLFSHTCFAELSISLSHEPGVFDPASIQLAHKVLAARLPVSVSSGDSGAIKCTLERANLVQMIELDTWVQDDTLGLIVKDGCRILIRAGIIDPAHVGYIIAHEIGHMILGKAHNPVPGSIMGESISEGKDYSVLESDAAHFDLQKFESGSIP